MTNLIDRTLMHVVGIGTGRTISDVRHPLCSQSIYAKAGSKAGDLMQNITAHGN